MLEHFLRHRRIYEIGLLSLVLMIQIAANTAVTLIDIERAASGYAAWEVLVWEASSNLVIILLLPALIWFDARFPLRLRHLPEHLLAHLAFTLPWSLAHVGLMVLARKSIYAALGHEYDFGPFWEGFVYEYLKDMRSYGLILAILYLYRFVLLRLQGEASMLDPGEGLEDGEAEVPKRLLVKKLGREFLVDVSRIEWLEASGNYVNLHLAGRLYPYRGTMASLEQALSSDTFVRVHRSHMVSLERVASIEPLDTGDARIHLDTGAVVPMSRRYRSRLKARLAVEQ